MLKDVKTRVVVKVKGKKCKVSLKKILF